MMATRWLRRSERGLATVEAILVVPLVLVPILLAVVVFGRLEHTRLVVDAAAAAGARQAAVIGGDGRASGSGSQPSCATAGSTRRGRSSLSSPAVAGWGEPIRVRVRDLRPAGIPFAGTWAVPLSGEFVTRSEVTP